MELPALRQLLDELLDTAGTRLRAGGVLQAVVDGVPVVAVECRVEGLGLGGVLYEGVQEVLRYLRRFCPAYARSQRPSALARSTSATPAGSRRPASASFSANSRFRFDHGLRDERGGVNRCTKKSSSTRRTWLSIQP